MGAEEAALTKAEQRIVSATDEYNRVYFREPRGELVVASAAEAVRDAIHERDAILQRIRQMAMQERMRQMAQQPSLKEQWSNAMQRHAYAAAIAGIQYNKQPVLNVRPPKHKVSVKRVLIPCFAEFEVTDGGMLNHTPKMVIRFHPRWLDRMQGVLGNVLNVLLRRERGVRLLAFASPDEMVALDGLMIGNLTEAEVEQPKDEEVEVETPVGYGVIASTPIDSSGAWEPYSTLLKTNPK